METIKIQTPSKRYPLFIGNGIRYQLQPLIDKLNKSFSAYFIITDEMVANHYLDDFTNPFRHSKVHTHIVPNGEQAKSIDYYYACITKALECGLDRQSCIIALGGGVIGDLAGFVAATYMRGIGFIQAPTTLLAHDSSVGGKVAINHPLGKNMIGAFYQPDAVIYDLETLQTLSDAEWRSGFAEIIKHGLIWNPQLFAEIRSIPSLHALKQSDLASILKKAIKVKAEIVSKDETEKGIRSFLNFGHTLGHAIEAELGYGAISHGEAVAIGMIFAMKLSEKHYNIDLNIKPIEKWLQSLGFITSIPPSLTAERLIDKMKKDKKSHHGQITMILLKEIGKVERVSFEEETLYHIIEQEIQREMKTDGTRS